MVLSGSLMSVHGTHRAVCDLCDRVGLAVGGQHRDGRGGALGDDRGQVQDVHRFGRAVVAAVGAQEVGAEDEAFGAVGGVMGRADLPDGDVALRPGLPVVPDEVADHALAHIAAACQVLADAGVVRGVRRVPAEVGEHVPECGVAGRRDCPPHRSVPLRARAPVVPDQFEPDRGFDHGVGGVRSADQDRGPLASDVGLGVAAEAPEVAPTLRVERASPEIGVEEHAVHGGSRPIVIPPPEEPIRHRDVQGPIPDALDHPWPPLVRLRVAAHSEATHCALKVMA
jgi:hypothetical protein